MLEGGPSSVEMLMSKNSFVAASRVFLASQPATVSSSHSRACSAAQGASVGTVAASDSRSRLTRLRSAESGLVGGQSQSQAGERKDELTFLIGGKGCDAELLGEREHALLAGTDILPAALNDVTAADRVIERPAADAIPGLEHADRGAGLLQLPRCRQARQPRSNDRHIHSAIGKCRRAIFHRGNLVPCRDERGSGC